MTGICVHGVHEPAVALSLDNECSICLDPLPLERDDTIQSLACDPERGIDHTFHKRCLDAWWNKDRSCPTCKREFIDFDKQVKPIEFESLSQFLWQIFCVCP